MPTPVLGTWDISMNKMDTKFCPYSSVIILDRPDLRGFVLILVERIPLIFLPLLGKNASLNNPTNAKLEFQVSIIKLKNLSGNLRKVKSN